MPALLAVFDVVEVAEATDERVEKVMETYFELGSRLELNWLRDRIIDLPRANVWQALAREAVRDELYATHRSLTQEALELGRDSDRDDAPGAWEQRHHPALRRCHAIFDNIKGSGTYDLTTVSVALREVRNLVRAPSRRI
jgi:glutamate dehydrogenase